MMDKTSPVTVTRRSASAVAPDLTCVTPVHSPLVSIATKHIVGSTAVLTADW